MFVAGLRTNCSRSAISAGAASNSARHPTGPSWASHVRSLSSGTPC